jgi:hypothetical protein
MTCVAALYASDTAPGSMHVSCKKKHDHEITRMPVMRIYRRKAELQIYIADSTPSYVAEKAM